MFWFISLSFVLNFVLAETKLSLKFSSEEIGESDYLSENCESELKSLLNITRNGRRSEILSTWTDFHDGISYGNSYDLGNFDNCFALQGRYCLVQFTSNKKIAKKFMQQSYFNFDWKKQDERSAGAVCVPTNCSGDEARQFLNFLFNNSNLEYKVTEDYNQDEFCKIENSYKLFSVANITLFAITTLVAVAVVLSTIYHHLRQNEDYLAAFSVRRHIEGLFTTAKDDITCLHLIRVLSMLSIVTFHSFFHRAMFPLTQPDNYIELQGNFIGKIVAAFNISVDTFFLLSGFLVTRSLLRDIDKDRFNIFTFYFNRYMRITPSVAFCVIVNICIMKYLIAFYPYVFHHASVEPCEKFWWSVLLHTQVYTNPKKLCFISSWYLSAEFSMFIILPLIVYPVWKFCKRFFVSIFVSLILASSILTFIECYQRGYIVKTAMSDMFNVDYPIYLNDAYYNPVLRSSTFFIGVIFGYLLYRKPQLYSMDLRLSIVCTLFAIIFVIFISTAFLTEFFFYETSRMINAIFLAVFRNLWALSVAYAIFNLDNGSWKWISWIFNYSFWIPFAKLTLCFYLIHPIVIYTRISINKTPINFEIFEMILNLLGDVIITLPFALFLYLFVEAPFCEVSKILTRRRGKNTQETAKTNKVKIITAENINYI